MPAPKTARATSGGVTANGGRGELSYDNQKLGVYGYASLHELLGNNVEDNTRLELGSGIYWYLRNNPRDTLTLGISGSAMTFKENQDFYTYGNGGYFSPQRFFSLGVPIRWAQSFDRFSYQVKVRWACSISRKMARIISLATARFKPPK